ncbi:MAG: hypothetical protein QXW32_07630 [Nitrososphaerales archaeon]
MEKDIFLLRLFSSVEGVKWVRMGPLERVETLLLTLRSGPKTRYGLYRVISGCAYQSLDRVLAECLEKGLVECVVERRFGVDRRVYRLSERGLRVAEALCVR